MIPSVDDFEKLGVFYLGRKFDLAQNSLRDDLLLYDSKDLCTHAMCVGMTGSGKTGLCLALLEEAAIDSIPVICVDPKGDLGNLMLTFPDLEPDDFEPWLEDSEAMRKGKTKPELAKDVAKLWRDGLAKWGQTPDRIKTLKKAAEVAIYTPGSSSGIPLTVLRSFDAPSKSVLEDSDAMRERITGAASGLLTLLGVEADPLLSREHILISSILDNCWRKGQNVSVADMIGLIQSPPFEKVGVLALESFMPISDRASLAIRLNNLLASPAFSTWLEGESLNIQKLLYNSQGRPRISILSIAHLNDSERMFFVTILLNELLSWMRSQSGTSSLRALFYMDEVFGYFPPSAKPPSKQPMMTLLKQARAFGLGIMLATQNPVDLDYKGLSNIGTWFLGRLQTERDKMRVLEGLEGAAAQTGQKFDRQQMEQTLAGLGNRVFLMNNVHDDGPSIFQTRWAMSYLAGPLARNQIADLMQDLKQAVEAKADAKAESQTDIVDAKRSLNARPITPPGVRVNYIVPDMFPASGNRLLYRPAIYCYGSAHYVKSPANVDIWKDLKYIVRCGADVPDKAWEHAEVLSESLRLSEEPVEGFEYEELPAEMCRADNFKRWEKEFKEFLYRHQPLILYYSPLLKEYAPADTTPQEARLALTQQAREMRDRETEKLRAKYASKMESLDRRIREAEERLAREKSELNQVSMTSVVDLGSSILGSLFGNKRKSRSRSSSVVKSATRAASQHGDVKRAEQILQDLSRDMLDLDSELRHEIQKVSESYDVTRLDLEETTVLPRKGDMRTSHGQLVWTPWQIDESGAALPLF